MLQGEQWSGGGSPVRDGRLGESAADDPPYQIARRSLVDGSGGYLSAVPEHRDAIRDTKDFIQSVCDIENPDAALPETLQLVEQEIDLAGRQRGSRLVENEKITSSG